MTDDRTDDRRDYGVFLAAIDHLRDDMREDNHRLEGRIMAVVTGFQTAHARVHDVDQAANEKAHDRFDAFIRSAELAQARREGALGVFRFVLEQLSRHWKPLLAILSGVAAVVLAAGGNIRFEVIAS